MVQNLRIVQNFPPSSWILSPPPELNPVSAPVCIIIYLKFICIYHVKLKLSCILPKGMGFGSPPLLCPNDNWSCKNILNKSLILEVNGRKYTIFQVQHCRCCPKLGGKSSCASPDNDISFFSFLCCKHLLKVFIKLCLIANISIGMPLCGF